MNTKEETIDTYETSAEALAEKFTGQGPRIKDIENVFEFINKENPFILEIGCAHGKDAEEILKRTDAYLGIDVSQNLIELARKNIPHGRFEVADMDTYDFPERPIDGIIAFASLIHTSKENVRAILERAHGALSEDGVFYLNFKLGEYDAEGFTKTDEFGTRTYYYYTPELIKELAGELYEAIFEQMSDIRDQAWFEIALKKI